MADSMKAFVCRGPDDYGLEDVSVPGILEPGDVIGRVLLTTISGADLAVVRGGIPEVRYPLIVGHEFCAEIVEIGPAVKNLKVGDRVVVSCVACCGECCTAGRAFMPAVRRRGMEHSECVGPRAARLNSSACRELTLTASDFPNP